MNCVGSAPAALVYPGHEYDALHRALRSEIAAYALMVDAKDETAAAFYRHHGFIALPDSPLTLFLPCASLPQSSE